MNENTKYKMGISLFLESLIKNYSPVMVSSLSKEGYDAYILKKGTVDEFNKWLNEESFEIEGFKKKVQKRLDEWKIMLTSTIDKLEVANLKEIIDFCEELLKY